MFSAIKNYPEKLEGGIIITGGGTRMKNIIEYINERTDTYAREGHHTDWLNDTSNPIFLDPILSQLAGTILLNDEYRKLHPKVEKKIKEPKIPKKGIKERITKSLFNFFGDDNDMN